MLILNMGKIKIARDEPLEEEEFEALVDEDFTREGIRDKAKLMLQIIKSYVEDQQKSPKSYRAIKDLGQVLLQYLEFMDKHPDEPVDVNLARDFDRFRQVVYEYVGPDGMKRIMALYDYRFGTPEEKKQAADIYNSGPTDSQLSRLLKERMEKWDKVLKRRFAGKI
ncbi:MAG: hypothetical protein DRP09_09980 [Candidatus Thorarchaeota archaeon]|nr:MAG: hypothetical protein DRP09_09980 [Candidatus Thorarchaeota archaeon]